mgnify:CR=1 FL=1
MKKLAKIFKALGNEKRLKILALLTKQGGTTVGEVSKEIGATFKATSQHLKILDGADLVRKEKKKNNIFYSLARFPQESLRRKIAELIESFK